MKTLDACYDFPEVVMHSTTKPCARYTGGVCHPKPQPVPPYNEDEAVAVAGYRTAIAIMRGEDVGSKPMYFDASGTTGSLEGEA